MKGILKSKKNIEALMPTYTNEGGNFTIIRLSDDDILLRKSLKSVLKEICNYYHHDLKASNREYRSMLKMKKMLPIPLTDWLVLIAIKTRIPIGKSDGAYSYINAEEVKDTDGEIIIFNSGKKLDTLCSEFTIKKQCIMGEYLKMKISEKYNKN